MKLRFKNSQAPQNGVWNKEKREHLTLKYTYGILKLWYSKRKTIKNINPIIHLIIMLCSYDSPNTTLVLYMHHLSNRSKKPLRFLAALGFSQNECKQSRGIQPSNDVKFCSVRRQHLSKPTFKLLPACAAAEELWSGFYRPKPSVKTAQNGFCYYLATMKEGKEANPISECN